MIKRTPDNKIIDAVILVDVNGNLLSASTPMPTTQNSSFADASFNEIGFVAHSFNVAAGGAGNYSKAQIFNPVGSGKKIIVFRALTWHATGSVAYQISETSSAFTDDLGVPAQKMCVGGRVEPIASLKKKNSDSTLTTLFKSKSSHSTTASNGSNVLDQVVALRPGYGLNVECNNANFAFNGVFYWIEIPE